MEKVLIILSFVAISSCQVCEECTTTTTVGSQSTVSTKEICGKKDIRNAEGEHDEVVARDQQGNAIQTIHKSTHCK